MPSGKTTISLYSYRAYVGPKILPRKNVQQKTKTKNVGAEPQNKSIEKSEERSELDY